MPVLKNARHERFAQARVDGQTIDKAFVTAGYSRNPGNAGRLNNKEHIQARIRELQAKAAKKVITTASDIVDQLSEDRDFARQNLHSAAAITATMGQAKVLGFLKDIHEHTGKDGAAMEVKTETTIEERSANDLARRIAYLLAKGQKKTG